MGLVIRFPASHDAQHAQRDSARAEAALRTALLSAQGADMVLGPLQGIGSLFSAACLLLRRRQLQAATLR
jgi:hypothetical protein